MAISSGVYSLLGVVVGSVSTGGFQLMLARRVDHLDARTAKRRVSSELQVVKIAIGWVQQNPKFGQMVVDRLAAKAQWEAHGDRLARTLSKAAWVDVDDAYGVAEALRRMAMLPSQDWGDALLADALARVNKALQHLTEPDPPDFWPAQT